MRKEEGGGREELELEVVMVVMMMMMEKMCGPLVVSGIGPPVSHIRKTELSLLTPVFGGRTD